MDVETSVSKIFAGDVQEVSPHMPVKYSGITHISHPLDKNREDFFIFLSPPEFDSFEAILGKRKWPECCNIKDFMMQILGKNAEFHRHTTFLF